MSGDRLRQMLEGIADSLYTSAEGTFSDSTYLTELRAAIDEALAEKAAYSLPVITTEEAQRRFIQHVWTMVRYWATLPDQTVQSRCEGVAFSILVAIDGASSALPPFELIPVMPQGKDAEDAQELWPQIDIAGGLHELLYKYE